MMMMLMMLMMMTMAMMADADDHDDNGDDDRDGVWKSIPLRHSGMRRAVSGHCTWVAWAAMAARCGCRPGVGQEVVHCSDCIAQGLLFQIPEPPPPPPNHAEPRGAVLILQLRCRHCGATHCTSVPVPCTLLRESLPAATLACP